MSKLNINGPFSIESGVETVFNAGPIEAPFFSIECDTGKVSDGFHSFDELYDHRCLNFLAFQALWHQAALPYSGAWKSRRHHDDTAFNGWFIAGLELPQGQITYHLPDKFWDLCKAPERERAPVWDGHTSQDVIERLRLWLSVPSFPAD
jgi:hypothetical protein